MKFLRVEVENWRPFRGHSSMDFASTGNRPITLVFGKNGGGKTSLLTAVYWCLYGAMDLEEGKGDQNLVNDHAVQEAMTTKDNPVDAVVTTFASRPGGGTDFLYRISRRQSAWDSGSNRRETQNGFVVERVKPHAGYRSGDNVALAFVQQGSTLERFEGSAAQKVIEKLLPQGLAKYFFYPGETLSFPFRNDKKSIGLLRGFLREISGGSKFAPFRERIKETKKKLDAKSKAHAEADKVTKWLQKSGSSRFGVG
ncbi:MAG: AAA family ATPase [Acidimicrobiaceae bacterium]|nr:AAA family ATPase [Acidimicrobiaceae bacterium]